MQRLSSITLPPRQLWMAWGVHIFTATGAVWGFLAIAAATQQQWQAAFLWLFAAALVDAIDGTLARKLQVAGLTPTFDGALLDNIVDYLTYVIVPAIMLYESGLLPPRLALSGVAIIMLSSAYQFCQIDAKTDDHYFKGFPSYWNGLVFYLFVLNWSPLANLTAVIICAILVFVPIKYIYPSRMSRLQTPTLILSAIWGIVVLAIFWQFDNPSPWLVTGSLFYVIYYVAVSLYLMAVDDTVASIPG